MGARIDTRLPAVHRPQPHWAQQHRQQHREVARTQYVPRDSASLSYAPADATAMAEPAPKPWQFHPHYSGRKCHEEVEEYEDDRGDVLHDFDSVAGSSVSGVSLRSKLAETISKSTTTLRF